MHGVIRSPFFFARSLFPRTRLAFLMRSSSYISQVVLLSLDDDVSESLTNLDSSSDGMTDTIAASSFRSFSFGKALWPGFLLVLRRFMLAFGLRLMRF